MCLGNSTVDLGSPAIKILYGTLKTDANLNEKPSGPSSRAAFQYPNFRRYMVARFLVTIALEMQSVAIGWQIYAITHRPLDLGLAGLAQFLPSICLFTFTGHVADRHPRQRIIQTCYAGFAVCSCLLLAFTVFRSQSVYPIYAILLLNGTVRAFQGPAGQAFIPLLVERTHFPNAVAWASSLFQVATIAGPMLGGVLYGVTGTPLLVYSIAAAASATAFILFYRLSLPPAERAPVLPSQNLVFDGLRYIWRNKLVLGAISLDLFAVLLGGAVALLPVYAREILNAGAVGLGILRSAPGVGAVIMSIVVAHWPLRRRAGATMLWCVFAFGIFTVLFGTSRNLTFSVLCLLLAGAADSVSVIIRHTMVQLSTPDEMRGRVSAVNMVFISTSNEVGQFESGLTAQWFGTVPAVVLGGLGTIAVVGLWAWLFPRLRRLDRLVPEEVPKTGAELLESEYASD
ncbi:MAG: MFS transporter [Acidobacteriaceae bacterium]|nr:MFS transporter [Acidobacteriaceae bacterium]MBV9679187.1 MFS transporter [Acidobacteriaceae bacterium]MBV9940399.1 MFS transporter [Acidobacteriaceae bacterium]